MEPRHYGGVFVLQEKLPCASAHGSFVYLTAAAANENDDKSDDDPPNVVVAEKIAKTVVHIRRSSIK